MSHGGIACALISVLVLAASDQSMAKCKGGCRPSAGAGLSRHDSPPSTLTRSRYVLAGNTAHRSAGWGRSRETRLQNSSAKESMSRPKQSAHLKQLRGVGTFNSQTRNSTGR